MYNTCSIKLFQMNYLIIHFTSVYQTVMSCLISLNFVCLQGDDRGATPLSNYRGATLQRATPQWADRSAAHQRSDGGAVPQRPISGKGRGAATPRKEGDDSKATIVGEGISFWTVDESSYSLNHAGIKILVRNIKLTKLDSILNRKRGWSFWLVWVEPLLERKKD